MCVCVCVQRALYWPVPPSPWAQDGLQSRGRGPSWRRCDIPGKGFRLRPAPGWVRGCPSAALRRLHESKGQGDVNVIRLVNRFLTSKENTDLNNSSGTFSNNLQLGVIHSASVGPTQSCHLMTLYDWGLLNFLYLLLIPHKPLIHKV